jgi:23S rRNA (adenine2503-C2)-methyltransferase
MWQEASYLFEINVKELQCFFESRGWSPTLAPIFFAHLHRHRHTEVAQLPKSRFPRSFLEQFEAWRLRPTLGYKLRTSSDGSRKYLMTLDDGLAVEAVFLPTEKRDTICLSSQVGCAMGCGFCATGTLGFRRSLSAGELMRQLHTVLAREGFGPGRSRRLNLVFMGMGEPLHQPEAVGKAVGLMTESNGLGLSCHDISVSTIGWLPGVTAWSNWPQRPRLLLSVGSTLSHKRRLLMPVEGKYPLASTLELLSRVSWRPRERLVLSFVVIRDLTDGPDELPGLIRLTERVPAMVNLIPFNPHPAAPQHRPPTEERLQDMFQTLVSSGVFTTIRRSKGADVDGACGQLMLAEGPQCTP